MATAIEYGLGATFVAVGAIALIAFMTDGKPPQLVTPDEPEAVTAMQTFEDDPTSPSIVRYGNGAIAILCPPGFVPGADVATPANNDGTCLAIPPEDPKKK